MRLVPVADLGLTSVCPYQNLAGDIERYERCGHHHRRSRLGAAKDDDCRVPELESDSFRS